jgi:hypothetical protein
LSSRSEAGSPTRFLVKGPGGNNMAAVGGPEKRKDGWRFKLYQLNADGQWDDRGTGFLSIKVDEVRRESQHPEAE